MNTFCRGKMDWQRLSISRGMDSGIEMLRYDK
jgi:hypothetical protein